MTKGIILIADNIKMFVDTRADFLERNEYKVYRAHSPQEAEQIMQKRWIHLAILDLRLTDDGPEDTSGLDLARDDHYREIPKMILTVFPTADTAVEALTPEPDGKARVLRYVSKKESLEEMIRNIEEIFQGFVRINKNLTIHWSNPAQCALAHLVMALNEQLDATEFYARLEEMEDLLRMVFFTADQLTISRMLWSRTGDLVLACTVFSGESTTPMLLHISQNLNEFPLAAASLQENKSDASIPDPIKTSRSLHYTASAWKLLVSLDDAKPLGEFISQNPERRVGAVLENVFLQALKPWYQTSLAVSEEYIDHAYRQILNINTDYLRPQDFEMLVRTFLKACISARLIGTFSVEAGQVNISLIDGQKISCVQPWAVLQKAALGSGLVRKIHSPGGIDATRVMVDRSGNVTLTDLGSFDLAPCERDFVNLEADLYFQAIETHDLLAIYNMLTETLLAGDNNGSPSVMNVDVECRKALSAILTIRRLAAECFQIEPLDYAVGLYFISLHRFSTYSPGLKLTTLEFLYYLQYLLICSLLAQKINSLSNQSTPVVVSGIAIDEENHQVSLDGHAINLTPTEYDLLLFLYHKGGNLSRRAEILQAVFHYQDADPNSEKSLLNTHMGRLRTKIEKDAANPRYILTVRGQGYKLIKQPK